MTHEDSSEPEIDPADAAEAMDGAAIDGEAVDDSAVEDVAVDDAAVDADSATESDASTVSLTKDDADADSAESVDVLPARVDTDEASARKPIASLALAVAVAALIAVVVCIGYFGYTGVRAYTVDSTATQLRDESLDVAQQAVLNITAVDPTDIPGWEKRLRSSLTGDALDQVKPDDLKKLVEQGQAAGSSAGKIESRIARSAVTALNTDEDTATVLVFANVTATNKDQPVQQSQMGFLLTIVDVDGTRKAGKVVALNPLEYSQTGSDVANTTGNGTAPKEGGN
ncbi:hypothetical protein [Gordonia hydrophobica]|uniref:Mce-associated membrane protein n=1 Tax=Gordonia hydrophobica TaxID=40516 RepID=A0ABZ2TVY8_9ACTN|nr:hypothetical protein [Gordonia hydrophobica]MBM7365915.1 hypothetical protein [Gordonia hydrophobica]